MKRFAYLIAGVLLSFAGIVTAANWHNRTDGTFCLEYDSAVGDLWCFDSDGITSLSVGGAITLENGESLHTGTDDTFDFTRDDAGTVTITASDNDATAALTVLPGGAAAMTLGGASTTAVTITTDGTGNGEVVLPAGSIGTTEVLDGTLLAADQAFPGRGFFEICGDMATVNNNTVYYGPSQAVNDSTTVGGVVCNTDAAGSTTEATADAPVLEATAIYPTGMVCYATDMGATGSPLTYTLRSAEAAITPAISVSIADNILSGATSVSATSAIASGATVAIALTSTGDVGAGAFYCRVSYAF